MAIEFDSINLGLKASNLFSTCTHEVLQALLFFLLLYNLGCFKPLELFLRLKLGALKPPPQLFSLCKGRGNSNLRVFQNFNEKEALGHHCWGTFLLQMGLFWTLQAPSLHHDQGVQGLWLFRCVTSWGFDVHWNFIVKAPRFNPSRSFFFLKCGATLRI
jgi:hypothetical protein